MSTDDFWQILEAARKDAADDAAVLTALTAELARRGPRAIAAFERHAKREVANLDLPAVRDVAEQLWVMSDEIWLNFRAWCVSQGRALVRQVTTTPAAVLRPLADQRAGPFDPPNGEIFLYCAEYARVARTVAAA